jgi:Family of unknown function (DUF6262)
MHPEQSTPLAAAAARRHELTRSKAIQALRELDRTGAAITFTTVAATAGISRSWLYTQPDIRSQIHRLRDTASQSPAQAIPSAQRAADASLRARLTAALHRNQQLADENARLRRQLAHALGDQRSSRTRSGNNPAPLNRPDHAATIASTTLSTTRWRRSQPCLTLKRKITTAVTHHVLCGLRAAAAARSRASLGSIGPSPCPSPGRCARPR